MRRDGMGGCKTSSGRHGGRPSSWKTTVCPCHARLLNRLVCVAWLSLWFALAAAADGTVSIGVSLTDFDADGIPVGAVVETGWDAPGHYAVTNSGSVPVRVLIHVEPAEPDGWLPGTEAGANRFRMAFALPDGGAFPRFRPFGETPAVLSPRLAPSEVVRFDLSFHAPRNTDVTADSQGIRITIAALPLDSEEDL